MIIYNPETDEIRILYAYFDFITQENELGAFTTWKTPPGFIATLESPWVEVGEL